MPRIDWKTQPLTDQFFHHIDESVTPSVHRFFATSALRRYMFQYPSPIIEFALNDDLVREIVNNRGVEIDRMRRITLRDMREPVIVCEMPDGTHLPVDGNHRIAAAYARGCRTIRGFFVPESVWENFLLDTSDHIFQEMAGMTGAELQRTSRYYL